MTELNPSQIKAIEEAPAIYRGALKRAYAGKSRAAAIKAFCLRCVGYQKNDVRDCTSYGCPLWPQRPYQRSEAK